MLALVPMSSFSWILWHTGEVRAGRAVVEAVLVGLFQLLTTPVANHMMGRASIRAGQAREELLVVNDLDGVSSDGQEPRGAP